jgi:hypothetical protein
MRTTLDVDDDVLLAARQIAAREGASIGRILSRLARQALAYQEVSENRNGVPLFPRQPDARVVTSDLVIQLREEEGL